jgi:hypothetical protein
MTTDIRQFGWVRNYSQRGEDGMIQYIFSRLDITDGYFVELGGWDGIYHSNVYNLVKNGWAGVYIEQDSDKYKQLKQNMKHYSTVSCIQGSVNLEAGSCLDSFLDKEKAPREFDLLSLDLDGYDYWVWGTLTYRPKLVVIEYNSNWDSPCTVPYDRNHIWDGTQFFGASAEALKLLADHLGYELIGHMPNNNLFFIHEQYNRGKFKVLDLSDRFHISTHHHKEMSSDQKQRLILDPPVNFNKKDLI